MMIGVIGGNSVDEKTGNLAFRLGREAAVRGHKIICGGKGGVMEAACRGAKSSGGLTVGILPEADLSCANGFLDVAIASGVGMARNNMIIQSSDVVIAVNGGYGTFSEIAAALNMGKPLVLLKSWDLGRLEEIEADRYRKAGTAKEAMDLAEEMAVVPTRFQ